MGAKRELRVYGGLKFKALGKRSAVEIRARDSLHLQKSIFYKNKIIII
jgi:hypothetical protein